MCFLITLEFDSVIERFRSESNKLYSSKSTITQDIDNLSKILPKYDSEMKKLSEQIRNLNNLQNSTKESLEQTNQNLKTKMEASYK